MTSILLRVLKTGLTLLLNLLGEQLSEALGLPSPLLEILSKIVLDSMTVQQEDHKSANRPKQNF